MVSKRRRYTREFKIETVRLITDSDQSVSEVARDLEIHPNTLYKWIHQYGENPKEAFPFSPYAPPFKSENNKVLRRSVESTLVFHQKYPTRFHARQRIFEYIERFYNRRRLHSTLGYKSPADYEATHFKLVA